ncbi:uncharacterized protein [Pyrus communis]|uniref:uncharacterized protein n=1 Tax=Pyrus communis TaxID=23211 RepID=UPI0035C13981
MAKHPRIAQYLDKVRRKLEVFETYTLTQVPRVDNAHVDALASLGFTLDYQLKRSIPIEYLDKPSIEVEPTAEVSQNDILIRRSYTGLHLCYLAPPDDLKVLSSIHEGICGNHSRGRSLEQKAFNACYYWPTMHQDTEELVQKCDRCQRYKPTPTLPANELHPQTSHWPFMEWAIDLV